MARPTTCNCIKRKRPTAGLRPSWLIYTAMNRKESKLAGHLTYEGKPCRRAGHIIKWVSNKACVECWKNSWTNKHWAARIEQRYGINEATYNAMLEQQGFRCKCCDYQPGRKLCIDHDHSTGKVRGLLCNDCNRALGFAKDDPKILHNLSLYLKGV